MAFRAGFAAFMLREKDLPGGALFALARPLADAAALAGRAFLVNDRVDVALALPGAGAHVGVRGLPVARARALLGPERLLGYSAHEVEEAREALAQGADYVTVSPIYPTAGKPGLPPRGLVFLRDAVARLPGGRVVALGGLDAARLPEVRAAGAAGAAVRGALMDAEDPERAARELVRAWG
jgi:thiamine-phosphate pyrophosphorylase